MADTFHFLRPYWLLAFAPLLLAAWHLLRRRLGSRNWEAFCDAELLPHILTGGARRGRRLHLAAIFLAGALAILALAGPAWKKLPQPVFSERGALVIALDLSRSMDANDISPSRVSRARFKISDILAARADGQTALLVYAGDAFVVTPLTDDTETILSQLGALGTDIMPVWGNRTRLAIVKARQLLQQAGMRRGHVLLITDEIELEETERAARELRAQGYSLSILGVGTRHGVPVPLADGSFLKDSAGEIIIPVLDERPLRELAALGGGLYRRLEKDDVDIQVLLRFFSQALPTQGDENTELKTDVWYEHGPWLLLLLLPLVALSFRKGYLLAAMLSLTAVPEEAAAFAWRDLWLTPDQQGERAMRGGRHKEAAELFDNRDWKAAAAYRAGDYAAALEHSRAADDVTGWYNRGNALARLGRYPEAIAAYEQALEQAPRHEDALFNKELLEQALQERQQQQQQQQGESQEQDGQEQGEQQQSDQQQDGQRQDGEQQQGEQQQQDAQSQESEQARQDSGEDGEAEGEEAEEGEENDRAQRQAERQQQDGEQAEQAQARPADAPSADETQQATEQWLRRIPDDPSGLLRRKFRHQYRRGQQDGQEEKSW